MNPQVEAAGMADQKLPSAISGVQEPDPENKMEFLTFSLRDQLFSIDIMSVREIRSWSEPTALPHAQEFMIGVVNLRGTVLPIIDLSARLDEAPTVANARNVIIVIEHNQKLMGLLVDSVSDILTFDPGSLQPLPDNPDDACSKVVNSVAVIDGTMIRMLNPSILFEFPEN